VSVRIPGLARGLELFLTEGRLGRLFLFGFPLARGFPVDVERVFEEERSRRCVGVCGLCGIFQALGPILMK
jgi:hypothetical protein